MNQGPSNIYPLHKPTLGRVEVLDRLMGSGKTYAALRHAEDSGERWIYCTVLNDDINRRTSETERGRAYWRIPKIEGLKGVELKQFLSDPNTQGIAITHSLLLRAARDPETVALIASRGYNLLLDETIDGLIEEYGGIAYGDFLWYYDAKKLTLDTNDFGKVRWTDHSVSRYEKYEMSIDALRNAEGDVYANVQGSGVSLVLLQHEAIFTMFRRMLLTTYQFESTLMAAYLEIKRIPWEPCTDIACPEGPSMSVVRRKISIITKYDRKFAEKSLGAMWYRDKAKPEDFALLKNVIRSVGDGNGCKGKPELLGYTLLGEALGSHTGRGLQVKGYAHTKMKDEDGVEVWDKQRSCYIPCNARASNEWACKRVMVHAFNRNLHPCLTNYLRNAGVNFSANRFALNELLQWLWRSAIRRGEPIQVAILSKRMRELFLQWLDRCEAADVVPWQSHVAGGLFERLAA